MVRNFLLNATLGLINSTLQLSDIMQLHPALTLIQSLKTCLDEVYAGRYSVDNVMRDIQNRARTLRQSGLSDVEQKNLKRELEQLNIKNELLTWYASNSVSPSYELLAEWFQSTSCTIEDKQLLAVCSLYELLKAQFSAQTSPINLIALGNLDFDNPERFCAFLLWILESGNNVKAIADSGILHHFFAYQFPFLSETNNSLHVVYRLFNQLNETPSVMELLKYVNNNPSGIQGVEVNHPVEATESKVATFKSSNLSGGDFEHTSLLSVNGQASRTLPVVTFSANSDDIVKLYRWSGIGMLKSLDVAQPAHRNAFNHIWASTEGEALRRELPALILRGEIPVGKARLWFRAIADEAHQSKRDINALLLTDPFYLYIFSGDLTVITELTLEQSILALQRSVAKTPVNSTSVILLVDLYKYLKGSHRSTMNEFILSQVARFTSRLPDEVFAAVKKMGVSEQQVQNRLNLFKQELIISFARDSFEPLQRKWGEVRACVYNLLDLCPQLRNSSQYPVDIYALKTFYIEQVWCHAHETFNLMATLMTMNVSDEDMDNINKRILLEALLFTQEPALQEIFIQYLDSKAIAWANEIFGDNKSLLEKSILHDNPALVKRILSLAGDNKPNQEAVSVALKAAASAGKLDIVIHLLNLTGDNKPDQEAVSVVLKVAASAGNWDIIIYLLNLTGDNRPDQAAVSGALEEAARYGNRNIVMHLLNFTGDNRPDQVAVSSALVVAARAGKLDIVINLLNLTGDNKPNQAAVPSALISAARAGKLDIVIHLLNLTGENKPKKEAVSRVLVEAVRVDNWDIVIHVQNLNGDNKPDMDSVSRSLLLDEPAVKLDIETRLRDFLQKDDNNGSWFTP